MNAADNSSLISNLGSRARICPIGKLYNELFFTRAKINKIDYSQKTFCYFCSKISIIMEEKLIKTVVTICQPDELPEEERQLLRLAVGATGRSYAPYSHFNVGAAVLLLNGKTVVGCNQENAAFGVSLCAERTALFASGAEYPDVPVVAIAIAARGTDGELLEEPVTPCGSCRQAMIETELRGKRPLRILLFGTRHVYALNGIASLMPLSFSADQL